jgi:hypothetical protein
MPHPSDRLKLLIQTNAGEISRLQARVHETFAQRDRGPEKRREWERACEIFHSRYNDLAFPGGFDGALDRIVAGDPESMEAAICFLELAHTSFGLAICLSPSSGRPSAHHSLRNRLLDCSMSFRP